MSRLGCETESEFPVLCESCLGENPYIRMTKETNARDCKVCTRPFTVFKWNPGSNMKLKRTEICLLCSKLKNTCQSCVLDLDYGLPTAVRDAVLQSSNAIPHSDINTQFYIQNIANHSNGNEIRHGKADSAAKEILKGMARKAPFYERNKAKVCSFFVKGECKKGDLCPFRHEKPEHDLNNTGNNTKDRFLGKNDPVANRILAKHQSEVVAPVDKSVSSVYLTGIPPDVKEEDIRNALYTYGEIKSCVVLSRAKCAFVNFAERVSAEICVERSSNLNINGTFIRVQWGKARKANGETPKAEPTKLTEMDLINIPVMEAPGQSSTSYPSMDPKMLGTSTMTYKA